eukprot:gb/GFBE01058781.1/.p1 GENE.gb/GFBE01058781.1/~~gb/GFBE01058781.1/.p1  ORF type:complete len:424 (+),score=143.20 gb/GFBE01058781.1/:1-1272(+)
MGWENFLLYAILPVSIFLSYRMVLKEALEDENAPKLLQLTPFLLAGITLELPQAMGIYIAMNIASSLALTGYTKAQISSKIPGYDEFVKTGKWPPGVDPEKVLAEAFGVKRLTTDDVEDPQSVPEAVFAGRADFIPALLEQGRKIDEFDDRGIPASAYTLALNNSDLLERLFEMGADPKIVDKRGNTLLHYCAGYGRAEFLPVLLKQEGLKEMLGNANEDGQTPLDVARVNLSQEKVADDVRKVIVQLNEVGAVGKATTQEDEARFEEAREKKKRDEQVKQARSALKALAMAAQQKAAPPAAEPAADATDATTPAHAEEEAPPDGNVLDQRVASPIQESLDRVRGLDIESLKERLGGSLSEEQLKKLSERLATMSPEELATYAAGLPMMKKAAEDSAAEEKAEEEKAAKTAQAEKRRESVIVD